MFNSKECRLCKRPITEWCVVVTHENGDIGRMSWIIICFECRDWAVENGILVDSKLNELYSPTTVDEKGDNESVEAINHDS